MNAKAIIAAVLVALGVVVLAYSRLSFTAPHFIPPVVGALALVGGIVLLAVNPKRAT
jgi:hypothetical protein